MKLLWLPLVLSGVAFAARADIVVPMNLVDENGVGTPIGSVTISESAYGLVFTPALTEGAAVLLTSAEPTYHQ